MTNLSYQSYNECIHSMIAKSHVSKMMVNDFGRFEYHIYLTRNYNGILQKDVFSYPCGGRYNHYSLSIDLRQCGANNTHDMRA